MNKIRLTPLGELVFGVLCGLTVIGALSIFFAVLGDFLGI